ncbi:unnamed protein product [Urochloa decumbens]|uniref:DUF4220 domain-containing protein n=1 Tax=Urochloa decumbens TaxID=240449 RepID=A0ABC9CFI5_9POAL
MNGTWMAWSHHTKDFWKSPRGTVVGIEVLVVGASFILLFMATFGYWRHQSRNFFIQKGVWGAYTLSYSLLSYTLGSMQSSAVKSSMYPIWAASLNILLGCADSITAYSIDDNNQIMTRMYQNSLYYAYAMLLLGAVSPGSDIVTVSYLALIAYWKSKHQLSASRLASISWNLNKTVADYMYQEHAKSGSSYDPTSMKDAAQVIDIERIWLCRDRVLSQELKDTCLSFSLFHLLRRRFFGFACYESSHRKTHDFVFKGLFAKNEVGTIDYNRAFNVIEVELAFMYYFFFTKYAVLYFGSKWWIFWSLSSASLVTFISPWVAQKAMTTISSNMDGSTILLNTTTADAVITVLILASTALLEFVQLLLYWTTIWGRVSFVCQYVCEQAVDARGSYFMRFREMFAKIGVSMSYKHYYRHKIGQYSLVESVRYDPNPSMAGVDVPVLRKYTKFYNLLDSSAFDHNMRRFALSIRKRHGKPVELPAEVKKALFQSLEHTNGKLSNGESSLVSNGAHYLLWACRHDMYSDLSRRWSQENENPTHVILTWHIATCYSEMGTLKCLCPRAGGELKFNTDVATKLSMYCVHLVVSAPKLLPGHHYDTSCVFDAVAMEATQFLPGDKYEAMRRLPESSEMKSIFQKGVRLGKQLEEMEEGARWKVLADFWAEMMLYVAPSDNVKEHIQCLPNGGEFITHIWALLTHAGILKRDQKNVTDIENVGADPAEGSDGAALRFRHASSCPLMLGDKQAATAT